MHRRGRDRGILHRREAERARERGEVEGYCVGERQREGRGREGGVIEGYCVREKQREGSGRGILRRREAERGER